MPRNTDLFDLIKSMTPAEKRQLRLSAGNNTGKTSGKKRAAANYLLLFDAIDAQNDYDEAAIRAQFADKAFVRQLHVTKNYLWQQIMKCLRPRYGAESRQHEIRELIYQAEVLYDRELFDQCGKILQHAEKLAREFECFAELLNVLSWKRKLTIQTSTVGYHRSSLVDVIEQERELIQTLQNLNSYSRLSANIYDLIDAERVRPEDPKIKQQLELLRAADKATSINARLLFYYSVQTYAFFQNDHDRACQAIESQIAMLDARPRYLREYPRAYITSLTNYAAVLLHLKRYDKFMEVLKRIRELPAELRWKDRSPTMVKALLQTYNLELEMYRDRGENARGLELEPLVNDLLNRFKVDAAMDYHMLFAYQFAYLSFRQKQYSAALDHLNRLFNLGAPVGRMDVIAYAHLLRLIIYFEQGHITVLKYAIEPYRRFIKKRENPMIFEREMLKYFAHICRVPPAEYKHEMLKLWQTFFEKERGLASVHPARFDRFTDFLNIRLWLEEHLGRRLENLELVEKRNHSVE